MSEVDPSAGGESFLEALPEDIRNDPVFRSVPDVATLAKNYVHAQRLIGTKRLPVPDHQKWGDKEWGDFYAQVGRPETPDKYSTPDIKFEEGAAWNEDRLKAAKEFFHKTGLTDRQSKGILEFYANVINGQLKDQKQKAEITRAEAMKQLEQEWGERTEQNVDLAKAVIKKFGDNGLLQYLEENDLGNNVGLVRALAKIGTAMMEDKHRGSAGTGLGDLTDETRAKTELNVLKTDSDFMAALNTRTHPAHDAAVERWTRLHEAAYPGQELI